MISFSFQTTITADHLGNLALERPTHTKKRRKKKLCGSNRGENDGLENEVKTSDGVLGEKRFIYSSVTFFYSSVGISLSS